MSALIIFSVLVVELSIFLRFRTWPASRLIETTKTYPNRSKFFNLFSTLFFRNKDRILFGLVLFGSLTSCWLYEQTQDLVSHGIKMEVMLRADSNYIIETFCPFQNIENITKRELGYVTVITINYKIWIIICNDRNYLSCLSNYFHDQRFPLTVIINYNNIRTVITIVS